MQIVHVDDPPLLLLDAAWDSLLKILHLKEPEAQGDILLFWDLDYDIDFQAHLVCEAVKREQGKDAPELVVLLVYRELEPGVFKPTPPGKRKLVIASSRFAEACLSIDGISYVIDSGRAVRRGYDPEQGLDTVDCTPISKTSAMLHAGVAGRKDKGMCFRLYAEQVYRDKMPPTSTPKIQMLNLSSVALAMKAMGIHDLFSFDFMDPPPPQALISATRRLCSLGALDKEGLLTQSGWGRTAFPLDPPLSKILLAGVELGCSDEILTIISMIITFEHTFYFDMDHAEVRKKRAKFFQIGGDFLTMLAIYEEGNAHNFWEQWCSDNIIRPALIRRAQVVKTELVRIMQAKCKLEVVSAGENSSKIREAIASEFVFNAAMNDPNDDNGYVSLVDKHRVYIPICSALIRKYPRAECVVLMQEQHQHPPKHLHPYTR